jgi:hypothetical protein
MGDMLRVHPEIGPDLIKIPYQEISLMIKGAADIK